MTAPGAASVTVSHTQVGRDLTVNVGTVVRQLSGRTGLAPPKLGDWGLVGREEELSRLHTEIQRARDSGSGAAEVVLAGLGGLGKTALALGYLTTHGADYDLVAWIDADNPDLIPAQYRRLVRNVTGQDLAEVDAVAAAKARLADSGDWLVIFDNGRSARDLRPFAPSGNGCVLVTTRNLNWSANRHGVVSPAPRGPRVTRPQRPRSSSGPWPSRRASTAMATRPRRASRSTSQGQPPTAAHRTGPSRSTRRLSLR